jgi:hypothetical protein
MWTPKLSYQRPENGEQVKCHAFQGERLEQYYRRQFSVSRAPCRNIFGIES